MARSDRRYLVYPSPRAVEVIGGTSPELNQALDCWAGELARAITKNAESFRGGHMAKGDKQVRVQASEHWTMLSVSLQKKNFDPEYPKPGELIASAVEEAERFEGLWTKRRLNAKGSDSDCATETELLNTDFAAFLTQLRQLDFVHAWAIINTIAWYWQNHTRIDSNKDQWWQLWFRLDLERTKRTGSEKAERQKKSPKVS